MDILEQMVNAHADAQEKQGQERSRRKAASAKNFRLHLTRAVAAIAIAISFMLFDLLDLAAPGLSALIAMVACMWACYSLGRCVRFGKAVR